MRKQMILPDDLCARVSEEAQYQHMNFTQYTVRALQQMVSADGFLRQKPDIQQKIAELTDMLSVCGSDQ